MVVMLCSSSLLDSYPPNRTPLIIQRQRNRNDPQNNRKIICSVENIGRLLWGRSLPPSFLISTVRSSWHSAWLLMMRQLAPTSSSTSRSYSRPPSQFPSVPKPYFDSNYNLSNLLLFASLPCPWAHRALLLLALTNLDSLIPVSVAVPSIDGAWLVDDKTTITRRRLKEVYGMRRGGYDGRATVPMLWDSHNKEVICNDSYGIIHFFNSVATRRRSSTRIFDLAPEELRPEIERWNQIVYPNVNNGVYRSRCGFAQSQEAYDTAVNGLFTTMDMLETHLSASRYLCGDALTLADVCLFTTLIRFDLVYNVLFKCTKKKLVEYPNLHAYMRDIYQIPKVAGTCNFEAIMDGYYRILFPLNPGSIRPAMPSVYEQDYLAQPHNRESLASSDRKQPKLHAL